MRRIIIFIMAILSFSQMCHCDINNFNHPPYVEDNEQIESQTVNQVKRPAKSFEEFYDVTTTKEELLIAIPSKSHDSSLPLKKEIISEIPVAVLYDSGSEIQRNDKSIDTSLNNKRPRRVKKRRRPQQVLNDAHSEIQKPDVNVVATSTNDETAADKLESTIPDNLKIETTQFRKVYKELKRTRPAIRELTPQPITLNETEATKTDSSTDGPQSYEKEYKEINRKQSEVKKEHDESITGQSEPLERTRTSEVYENQPKRTVNRGQVRHKPRLNQDYIRRTQESNINVESKNEHVASRQPVTQTPSRRRNIRPRVSATRSSSPENVTVQKRVQEDTEIKNINTGREVVKSFVTETSTSKLYSTTAAETKETTKAIEITTQQTLLTLDPSKESPLIETTQLLSQSNPNIILKNKYKVQDEYNDRASIISINTFKGEAAKSNKNHELNENEKPEITTGSNDKSYLQLNRGSDIKEVSSKEKSYEYYTTPKVITEYEDHTKTLYRNREPIIKIINSESYVHGDTGDFHFRYEGEDGTKNFERGQLKRFDDDITGEAVSGGYSYKDKEGKEYSLSYTADENGYRPVGDHLPTPPPIPPYILRALEHLATKTTPAPVTEPIENE